MKIYAVLYNYFIMESAYETISLHKTKVSAAKAMLALKSEKFYDTLDNFNEDWQKFGYKIFLLKD